MDNDSSAGVGQSHRGYARRARENSGHQRRTRRSARGVSTDGPAKSTRAAHWNTGGHEKISIARARYENDAASGERFLEELGRYESPTDTSEDDSSSDGSNTGSHDDEGIIPMCPDDDNMDSSGEAPPANQVSPLTSRTTCTRGSLTTSRRQ